jgi:hypothetical protein
VSQINQVRNFITKVYFSNIYFNIIISCTLRSLRRCFLLAVATAVTYHIYSLSPPPISFNSVTQQYADHKVRHYIISFMIPLLHLFLAKILLSRYENVVIGNKLLTPTLTLSLFHYLFCTEECNQYFISAAPYGTRFWLGNMQLNKNVSTQLLSCMPYVFVSIYFRSRWIVFAIKGGTVSNKQLLLVMKTRCRKISECCRITYSGHTSCRMKENQILLALVNFNFGKQFMTILL